MDSVFNIVAVSAPQWVSHKTTELTKSLTSSDPFSLQNALRLAAWNAQNSIGYLGESNWRYRSDLRSTVRLMNYLDNEISDFIDLLHEVRPNLLFIGAMTLSYPGAIELARCAKDVLGEDVFVVLGGKHCIETFWHDGNRFCHHNGSPLKNIAEKKDPKLNVFDLVISGDGEESIVKIAEIIGELVSKKRKLSDFSLYIDTLKQAKGNWIGGWVDKSFNVHEIIGGTIPLNYDEMPSAPEVFGITANFPIFQTEITAHAYSDMSKGCVYDCFFCSERSSINGKIIQKQTAAQRLFRQFEKIKQVGLTENDTCNISAFVEDSIILAGNVEQLNELNRLLVKHPLGLKWGCQFSIDVFLKPEILSIVRDLKDNGLVYILFGMETINENIALKMSKNFHKDQKWKSRNEQAMEEISRLGLKAGFCILWGLGEHQSDRSTHLRILRDWQHEYGVPNIVSLNWAVKHPLRNLNPNEPNYMDWGTGPKSEYLDLFIELFGEASENYNLLNVESPPLSELKLLRELYYELIYDQIEYINKIKK